jgi:hypothetical protein
MDDSGPDPALPPSANEPPELGNPSGAAPTLTAASKAPKERQEKATRAAK